MDPFTLDKLEFDRVRQVLAGFCRCSLGRELALRIVPSRRPETIRAWLDQTTEMVAAVVECGTPPFGGITDIHLALGRAIPGGGADGHDFAAIADALDGCGRVRAWMASLGESRPLLRALGERLSNFDGEIRAIHAIIDARGEVKTSASEHLTNIRRETDSCQQQIRQVVYSFVRRADVVPYLQSTNVQMHEDRYVLPVKAENRGRLAGVVHRSSHTGATVFVEPAECVELNNRLVRLHDEQRDEIARLLGQLAIRVHARHEDMDQSLRTLAQIDLITAKAQYSYQFEMVAPEITERGHLQFLQARHPLLIEQRRQDEVAGLAGERHHRVVPIDVRLGLDFDLLIITGSNTGGKTVTMKTVGLLVLMAQSGMHIPAQRGCTMPVFRDVLIDIGDEQSLEQSLSTFGAHLGRIRRILRKADRYTLVLLDELGSGTDPEEGGSIGQAVLDELRAIGCVGMASTHLGALKAYAYANVRVDNASVEFDTRTLQPTYHLLIGQPGESHAIAVAQHLGLPKRVIQAARKHLPRHARQIRQVMQATAASRQASETARSEAETAKAQALSRQQQYERKLNDLQRLSDQFGEWVASLPAMQPGDEVFVRKLNKAGTLERLQLSRQIAVVNVERMQVEVPLAELMPDFGQPQVREEIATLRRQIAAQAHQTEEIRADANRARAEFHRSLSALRARQRAFANWLAAVRGLTVGQEVHLARSPGHGKVVALNLAAGRVTVETDGKQIEVPFQQLLPEHSLFGDHGGPKHGHKRRTAAAAKKAEDRPMPRRSPESRKGRSNREAVLHTQPGQQVYVVPFHKRATLVRIEAEKGVAVVDSGAFEIEIPLSDLEPVRE